MTYYTKQNAGVFLTLVNRNWNISGLYRVFIFLFIFGFTLSIPVFSQARLQKIVIDAGHGGKDPGASGKYTREKDVVLNVALQTGKIIKQKYPDVEIIYTRQTDVFIPLKERAEIANKANADLFVSIHCNANKSSTPNGSETYVMGLHKSEANLEVAKTENAAILFEDDFETQYDGFDPTSEESHIIFNFFQNSFLSTNLDIATKIQKKFTANTPLKDRGVKQAGFWVLYKTTMPGVLIETGFLSNATDEKFLNSAEGQKKLSESIAAAIIDYKISFDEHEAQKAKIKPATSDPSTSTAKNTTTKKDESKLPKKQEQQDEKKTPEQKTEDNSETTKTMDSGVVFKVQFLSLPNETKLTGEKYKELNPISSYHHNGAYRYTTGSTSSFDEATKIQSRVRKQGFSDAFVVAFLNGKRISIDEAQKMSKTK